MAYLGATVGATNYSGDTNAQANTQFNTYTVTPMAVTAQKIYYQEATWPGSIPAAAAAVIGAGGKVLLSLKPSRTHSSGEKTNLANAITMYRTAGAIFDVTLWQEPNTGANFTPAAYQGYLTYYAPTVRAAGVTLVYNPSVGNTTYTAATMYPGDSLADAVVCDYYGNDYALSSLLLDSPQPGDSVSIMSLADGHSPSPIPFGLGEWNAQATTLTITTTQWNAYVTYLTGLFQARTAAGKVNGDLLFWMGDNAVSVPLPQDQVGSGSDFKIPMIQSFYSALSAPPPGSPVAGSPVASSGVLAFPA
jgi:hypothetical protein